MIQTIEINFALDLHGNEEAREGSPGRRLPFAKDRLPRWKGHKPPYPLHSVPEHTFSVAPVLLMHELHCS